jgi:hypothetical protein
VPAILRHSICEAEGEGVMFDLNSQPLRFVFAGARSGKWRETCDLNATHRNGKTRELNEGGGGSYYLTTTKTRDCVCVETKATRPRSEGPGHARRLASNLAPPVD